MMKNYLIFSALVGLCLVGVLTQSCSKDSEGDNAQQVLTKADLLVTSAEFKEFENQVNLFGRKIKDNTSKLSSSEHELYRNKLNQIVSGEVTNPGQIQQIFQDAGTILDIDLESEIYNIQKKASVISSDMNDLSRKDLVASLYRMQISNSLIKTRAEMGTDCWNKCTLTMTLEMALCTGSGPLAAACVAAVILMYDMCLGDCPQ